MTKIKVGARPSRLALKQVEEIKKRFPKIDMQVVPIYTQGDLDKTTSLLGRDDSDFFTREIETALLNGDIDMAVHSAKDLEENTPKDLIIAAMTDSISPFECLVSRGNLTLDKLSLGARVGTSSLRRKECLLNFRPDLKAQDIRGNIEERLKQLDENKFDAVILAHAALIRLGLEERIAQIIPEAIISAHPLQGRLAIQIRKDRDDLLNIFRN